jgi:L-fuconolactonase
MQVIDAHQHLWQYDPAAYPWIDGPLAGLRQDFGLAELAAMRHAAGVDATIAVQARQSLEETAWLLGLAEREPAIVGVVGWVPLASPQIADLMAGLLRPTLKGVRHVVQAEPAGFLDAPGFAHGLAVIGRLGLTYDLLVLPHQLDEAIRCVDRHPDQRFVLDHAAKPLIAQGALEPWATAIRALAKRPQVWCKISGLVTEADHQRWAPADLAPYLAIVLDAFTPDRLLYGSDWPVCTAAASAARWRSVVDAWIAPLTAREQAAILGGNARTAYRL